jgi:hypothetical protein
MIGIVEDIALIMLKIAKLDILNMDANSVIESRPFQQSIGITDGRWLDIFSSFSIYFRRWSQVTNINGNNNILIIAGVGS